MGHSAATRRVSGPALQGGLLLMMLALAACSPTRLLSGLSPSGHYALDEGIVYGDHPRMRLDVYRPHDAQSLPVVVYFYGGAWARGARDQYGFVGAFLTGEDVIAVLPDYRLHPEVGFPDFVHDAAAAVAWVQREIAAYGGDPERIILMGHSAGAHIAALLALDTRYLAHAGKDQAPLYAFIGLSGPYDFERDSDTLKKIFAAEQPPQLSSQPIDYAGGDAPPMLLVHGGGDRVVEPGNTLRLARSVCDAGGEAEVIVYPGVGHARVAAALAPPLGFAGSSGDDVAAFLRRLTAGELSNGVICPGG